MHHIILTPGEKLQYLRKKYRITQQQLCKHYITRNMLSMIETNKAPLNTTTAQVLLDHLYIICQTKGLVCTTTLEELLESVEDQAHVLCMNFIEDLNDSPITEEHSFLLLDRFKQITHLLNKYNLREEKTCIYYHMGKCLCQSHAYEKAYHHYLIAFESRPTLFDHELITPIICGLMFCCGRLNKHKESIEFARLAYMYDSSITPIMNYKLKYNLAVAYANLDMYDMALKEINYIIEHFHSLLLEEPIKYINILQLKSICYSNKHLFDESIHTYNQILQLDNVSEEMTLITLANISIVYFHANSPAYVERLLIQYQPQIKRYLLSPSKNYAIEIYKEFGEIYYKLNQLEESTFYYKEALSYIKTRKTSKHIIAVLSSLLHIYIQANDCTAIDGLKEELFECILAGILPDSSIISELIQYYNGKNDQSHISEVLEFTLQNYYSRKK